MVSIIIPAFNVEKFIEETLESIKQQTITDYEVIIINDGSTDKTKEVIEANIGNDERFVLISQDNMGVSAARNTGLNLAVGEYVFFLDGDDKMAPDALLQLYQRARDTGADLVVGKYCTFNEYQTTEIKNIDSVVCKEYIYKYDLDLLWTYALWNKLYRRSLIEKLNLRFVPIINMEDGLFVMTYVYHARLITGLEAVVCYYRKYTSLKQASATNIVTETKIEHLYQAHEGIIKEFYSSIENEYQELGSLDTILSSNAWLARYNNQIIIKHVSLLINLSLSKFWYLREELIEYIVKYFKDSSGWLNFGSFTLLADKYKELNFYSIPTNYSQALQQISVSVILFGEENNELSFLNTLQSLSLQNYILMNIIVPQSRKACITEQGLDHANIVYINESRKGAFYQVAINQCHGEYVMFANDNFYYAENVIKTLVNKLRKTNCDFITEQLYYADNYSMPIELQRISLEGMTKRRNYQKEFPYDCTLSNKVFRSDFLLKANPDYNLLEAEIAQDLLAKGYFTISHGNHIFFKGSENEYVKRLFADYKNDAIYRYLNPPEKLFDEIKREARQTVSMVSEIRSKIESSLNRVNKNDNRLDLLYEKEQLKQKNSSSRYAPSRNTTKSMQIAKLAEEQRLKELQEEEKCKNRKKRKI